MITFLCKIRKAGPRTSRYEAAADSQSDSQTVRQALCTQSVASAANHNAVTTCMTVRSVRRASMGVRGEGGEEEEAERGRGGGEEGRVRIGEEKEKE